MDSNRLRQLEKFGQSLWLDYIRRNLLTGDGLARMIAEDGLKGLTSNPAIFEKAIAEGAEYRNALAAAVRGGERDPERIYEQIAIDDIRLAADRMTGVHAATGGRDGYVSLEVSPRLARETQATVAEARRLWRNVDRANLMIKVPATPAGLPAIEALVAEGINVNVTLLFSVAIYREVAGAYFRGLERRAQAGGRVESVASVASFFVSRIDTEVDTELGRRIAAAADGEERRRLEALRGKAAIASARLAYAAYRELCAGELWRALAARGARPQRLLWASTGTKNRAYPDTLYVDELIGPETVTTLPPATLDAFRDHGRPGATLEQDLEGARGTMRAIIGAGIAFEDVTARLLEDGVRLFADAYDRLQDAVRRAREAA